MARNALVALTHGACGTIGATSDDVLTGIEHDTTRSRAATKVRGRLALVSPRVARLTLNASAASNKVSTRIIDNTARG